MKKLGEVETMKYNVPWKDGSLNTLFVISIAIPSEARKIPARDIIAFPWPIYRPFLSRY